MAIYFPPNQPDGTTYTANNGVVYEYDANRDTWTAVSTTGHGVEEAPHDNVKYTRYNESWEPESVSTVNSQDGDVNLTHFDVGAPPEAPLDSENYVRRNAQWVTESVTSVNGMTGDVTISAGGSGDVEEAPIDGVKYVRRNEDWEAESVSSVNGKTGTIVLDAADVGAATETWVLEEIAGIETTEFHFKGDRDCTTEDPPADAIEGDIWMNTVTGTVKNTWNHAGGLPIVQYQLIILADSGEWFLGTVQGGGTSIPEGNGGVSGILKLSDSVSSPGLNIDAGTAATPYAVSVAYDKAVEALTNSGGGLDQGTADSRYVRLDGTGQNIQGTKKFESRLEVGSSAQFQLQKDGNKNSPCIDFPNNLNLYSRRNNTGNPRTSSQDLVIHRNDHDDHGIYMTFIDGDNSGNYGNVKVGLRRNNPEYALDIDGSMQVSQVYFRESGDANNTSKGITIAASGGGGTISGGSDAIRINNFVINNTVSANGNATYINLENATRTPFMHWRDDINFRQFQSSDGGNTLYGWSMYKGSNSTGSGVVYAGWINNNGNCKWGFRTHRPETALHVSSTIKANQYQDARSAEFTGAFFRSPVDGINFQDRVIAEDDLVLNKAVYTKAPENNSFASAASVHETAVAKQIKAALTKYTEDGKTRFGIDTTTLESIFTTNGLTIGDYGIVKTLELDQVIQEQNRNDDGTLDPEEPDRVYRAAATTYKSIDYQALFAFIISAMPDFDALEARIAALEAG